MFRSRIKNILPEVDYSKLQDKEAKKEFSTLLEITKKNIKNVNEKLLKKAFLVCLDAHKDRVRLSGEPFYKHSIAIAKIVADEIKIDDVSVAAALLFEVIREDSDYDYKLIQNEFGITISEIIQSMNKINQIEEERIKSEAELENYRKLLMSLFKDVRIIFIKLAERVEHLRTLQFIPENYQKKSAKEALEVFAPFANRFGFRNIKWEIEDLSFKYLNREAYDDIKKSLLGTRKEREQYVKDFEKPLQRKLKNDSFLKKNKVKVDIKGRAKHIYSIYNKMHARGKPVDELYDLIAIRLIIDSDDPNICFYIYGIVASIYPPVPETFKDYINSPKQNGYQSIHVAVLGPQNKPVEVQLRTIDMHEVAERGVAAHFNYKRGLVPAQSVFDDPNATEWMDSVREMIENNETETPEELFNFLKKNLFIDEIHVFSPKNELFTFPRDATPLDFAFAIHSEVGYRYLGAKVNGKIVPVDYKMQSGDQISILTSDKETVKEEWLSIVRTSRSKSFINKYIKIKRKKIYTAGRRKWKHYLQKKELGVRKKHIDILLEKLNISDEHELYTTIGKGELDIDYVFNILEEIIEKGKKAVRKKRVVDTGHSHDYISSIIIHGEDRTGIVSDISKKLIATKGVTLNGVTFDTLDDKFEGRITMKLDKNLKLDKVIQKIMKIEGVESINVD